MVRINILNGVRLMCRGCGTNKPLHEFTEHRRLNLLSMAGVHAFGREHICKPCGTKINTDKMRHIKAQVIAGYGAKCNCPGCGVTEVAFLCLDHVIPCGGAGRGSSGCESAWRDALRRHFPPDYQLLCYNCNCAKAFYPGGCPHQIRSAVTCPSEKSPSN